ncbi:hypothetical protein HMPREF2626_01935 [Aerococcus sp. HMSC062A02]|nr:hypothetical protein HMPREF2626_01935 [Aerococcus sp. HMSC062A02]OHO45637.1 hypothetical protein HMPREF2705_04865 [Aerococcus sp. HMSC035B07]
MQKESINLLGSGFLHELIVGIKKRPEQKSSSLFLIPNVFKNPLQKSGPIDFCHIFHNLVH